MAGSSDDLSSWLGRTSLLLAVLVPLLLGPLPALLLLPLAALAARYLRLGGAADRGAGNSACLALLSLVWLGSRTFTLATVRAASN